ncbi:MAG: hypothetical protein Q9223_006489 [Gallowayella weberi]
MSTPLSLSPALFNKSLYARIISLWFSDLPPTASAPTPTQLSKWFGVGATPEAKRAFDNECASIALPALQSITADKFPLPTFTNADDDRKNYPRIAEPFLGQFNLSKKNDADDDDKEEEEKNEQEPGNEDVALGLILLLDQMPRNIFRTNQSPIYTHYDRISRAIAYTLIFPRNLDRCPKYTDSPPYRMWFYLPLMHSEALSEHDLIALRLGEMRARCEDVGDEAGKGYMDSSVGFEKRHRSILERFGRYPHRNVWVGREETREEREWLAGGGDTFGSG